MTHQPRVCFTEKKKKRARGAQQRETAEGFDRWRPPRSVRLMVSSKGKVKSKNGERKGPIVVGSTCSVATEIENTTRVSHPRKTPHVREHVPCHPALIHHSHRREVGNGTKTRASRAVEINKCVRAVSRYPLPTHLCDTGGHRGRCPVDRVCV